MLTEPPVEHKLIGPRLLDKSRKALRRISTLAGLYRLDGNKEWAERARKEMLAAAAFPDWNPSHFLDVAEMSTALGLGYDWLYAYLSAEDRATIRTALVEKGLKPGMDVYKKGGWWTKAKHNWNQVCNGGLTIGALAIADEEPELARAIVTQGRASIPLAMASFAPDGGWAEGPGYWAMPRNITFFTWPACNRPWAPISVCPNCPASIAPVASASMRSARWARPSTSPMRAMGPAPLPRCSGSPAPSTSRVMQPTSAPWPKSAQHLPLALDPSRKRKRRSQSARQGSAASPGRTFQGCRCRVLPQFLGRSQGALRRLSRRRQRGQPQPSRPGQLRHGCSGPASPVDLGGDDYNLPGYFGKSAGAIIACAPKDTTRSPSTMTTRSPLRRLR